MAYWDVVSGRQTWSDYISGQDVVHGIGSRVETAMASQSRTLQLGLDSDQYRRAVEDGFGSLSELVAVSSQNQVHAITIGLDAIADGLESLQADFHIAMTEVMWKLELQTDLLTRLLKVIQRPLDTLAKELRNRAEFAYKNGWYNEAESDLLKCIDANYQDFVAHRTLGNIYLVHRGDAQRALGCFKSAARYSRPIDSKHAAEAHYFAAVTAGALGDVVDGFAEASESSLCNPNLGEAWYLRACFAACLKDVPALHESLTEAVAKDARYFGRIAAEPFFEGHRTEIGEWMISEQDRVNQLCKSSAPELKWMLSTVANWEISERDAIRSTIAIVNAEFDRRDYASARTALDRLPSLRKLLGDAKTKWYAEENRRAEASRAREARAKAESAALELEDSNRRRRQQAFARAENSALLRFPVFAVLFTAQGWIPWVIVIGVVTAFNKVPVLKEVAGQATICAVITGCIAAGIRVSKDIEDARRGL